MEFVKVKDRNPSEKGFYTIRGLNNQGNTVENHDPNEKVWFSGTSWIVREGCEVIGWFDESKEFSPKNPPL